MLAWYYIASMQKIFITGVLGYLGSKLAVEALKKGHSVFLYDSLLYKQDYKKILADIRTAKRGTATCQFVMGDVRNTTLLRQSLEEYKPDFLVHFAELAGIYICNDNPLYTRDINFEASKKVLDIAEELRIPVIYNSSSSLYGNQKGKRLLDESSPLPAPTDNYCRYKLLMEKYIKEKVKAHPTFKIIVLRPSTAWGVSPRMRVELMPNHFIYCAVAKGLISISEPEAYRADINVDDLVGAYFAIMKNNNWKKLIYNVSQHNVKKVELAETIQSLIDCNIAMAPGLGDPRDVHIDSSAFCKDFDYKPKHSSKSTIQKVERWIRTHKKEMEKSNFGGMINTPLAEWLRII